MVYRRRLRRRFPRRIRRRSFRRYRTSFRKKVKRTLLQTAELKNASTTIANQYVNVNYTRLNLTPSIPQGAGDNERVGNKIMSRNYQVKLHFLLGAAQNPPGDVRGLRYVRVYIVWPRKLSNVEAINYLNAGNFPLFGLMDQDNWIVWYDRSFTIAYDSDANPTYRKDFRIIFNKRFYAGLEYVNAVSVQAVKGPWMIVVHNIDVVTNTLIMNGYNKLTYKDI